MLVQRLDSLNSAQTGFKVPFTRVRALFGVSIAPLSWSDFRAAVHGDAAISAVFDAGFRNQTVTIPNQDPPMRIPLEQPDHADVLFHDVGNVNLQEEISYQDVMEYFGMLGST